MGAADPAHLTLHPAVLVRAVAAGQAGKKGRSDSGYARRSSALHSGRQESKGGRVRSSGLESGLGAVATSAVVGSRTWNQALYGSRWPYPKAGRLIGGSGG